MPAASSRATAADLVALAAALDRDEQRPAAEVRARDLRIGAEVIERTDDHAGLALGWLEQIAHEDATVRDLRERVTSALHACGLLAGALGLVLGWLAALAAFYYEGSGRVNVIAVLVVLVGVPAIFLLLFLIAALPRRAIAWLPGATAASGLARAISPGRLAQLALRFVPHETRDAISGLRSRAGEHQKLFARVQKWLLLRWSQVFAVTFQCGALSATLGLVLFTDLVFGWSTTLASGDPALDAARVHEVTTAISVPWSWVAEDAVPTLELIRESRYYRVVDTVVSPEQASRLGGWWPFLVLAMLVYGLIPRLVVLGLAQTRLSTAIDRAVAMTPGVSVLVRRLQSARVQTSTPGAEGPFAEESARTTSAEPETAAQLTRAAEGPAGAIINWAEVPAAEDALKRMIGTAPVFHAGGAATLAADEAIVARVAQTTHAEAGGTVAIVVKAWEPPLLEFIDFVQALRRALGDGAAIVVFPASRDEAGALRGGAAAHVEVWRRRLDRVGDPWLRVAELNAEARQ